MKKYYIQVALFRCKCHVIAPCLVPDPMFFIFLKPKTPKDSVVESVKLFRQQEVTQKPTNIHSYAHLKNFLHFAQSGKYYSVCLLRSVGRSYELRLRPITSTAQVQIQRKNNVELLKITSMTLSMSLRMRNITNPRLNRTCSVKNLPIYKLTFEIDKIVKSV